MGLYELRSCRSMAVDKVVAVKSLAPARKMVVLEGRGRSSDSSLVTVWSRFRAVRTGPSQGQTATSPRDRPSGPGTIGPQHSRTPIHNPGSTIHGNTSLGYRPATAYTSTTAQRVVRSSPVNPTARSR
jgi:hypothetical protein